MSRGAWGCRESPAVGRVVSHTLRPLRQFPLFAFTYFKSLLPGGLQELNHLQGRSKFQHSCDPDVRGGAIHIALAMYLQRERERELQLQIIWGVYRKMQEGTRVTNDFIGFINSESASTNVLLQ